MAYGMTASPVAAPAPQAPTLSNRRANYLRLASITADSNFRQAADGLLFSIESGRATLSAADRLGELAKSCSDRGLAAAALRYRDSLLAR